MIQIEKLIEIERKAKVLGYKTQIWNDGHVMHIWTPIGNITMLDGPILNPDITEISISQEPIPRGSYTPTEFEIYENVINHQINTLNLAKMLQEAITDD